MIGLNLEFNNEDVNNLIASYEERLSNEYSIEQEKSMEIKNERKDEDPESIVKSMTKCDPKESASLKYEEQLKKI
ncbi:hypothetical protein HZS_222 [Henneguya salminicola]|nr:hypothetical protein HZS_222 [Henneguya salminicola]